MQITDNFWANILSQTKINNVFNAYKDEQTKLKLR